MRFRCGISYGMRWYEFPVVMTASIGVHMLEAPGMLAAFRGNGFGHTYFR
jgi:hypothetical protein